MNIYFVNPPFKAEFGKFSRESRSPAITKSGALYYPLWLIYAALYSQKHGHKVHFLDAPAKQLNEKQSLEIIQKENNERTLFVLDTSTPSILLWGQRSTRPPSLLSRLSLHRFRHSLESSDMHL